MMALPSFETGFSSLVPPPPPVTAHFAPVRPSIAPLQLDDLLSGDAPTFGGDTDYGFARVKPPLKRPAPLRLPPDSLAPVLTDASLSRDRKRQLSPSVHAGAYKRPRTSTISAGAYVKGSRSVSETESRLALAIPALSKPHIPSLPSFSHRTASRGILSYNSLSHANIIEDSTRDVLSTPLQRSLTSAATGTNLIRNRANALSLVRGPTPSDLSHLLGETRNLPLDVAIVDGTDLLARKTTSPTRPKLHAPRAKTIHSNAVSPADVLPHSDQPPTTPRMRIASSNVQTGQSISTSLDTPSTTGSALKPIGKPERKYEMKTPSFLVEATKRKPEQQSYGSFGQQSALTLPASHGTTASAEPDRREPWRQQPPPKQQSRLENVSTFNNRSGTVKNQLKLPFVSQSIPTTHFETRSASKPNLANVTSTPLPEAKKWGNLQPTAPLPSSSALLCNSVSGHIGSATNRDVLNLQQRNLQTIPATVNISAKGAEFVTENATDAPADGVDGRENMDKVKCPHCPRHLQNQITLQNHIRVVHNNSGKYKCPHPGCKLTFTWKSTLGNHVKLVHQKLRPHPCKKCPKAFRWKSHLREHCWVTHDGEKPFMCSICGKMFGRKNNMQKHVKNHSEESAIS